METIRAKSTAATLAYQLVSDLQQRFVNKLNVISEKYGENKPYAATQWLRDQGVHGGGIRFMATDESIFNRASVNISQVQYDDDPSKKLASASAVSTIIHPKNPLAPSVHIHISWTEMKTGHGFWRVMADLNPAIEFAQDTSVFNAKLKQVSQDHYQHASEQGDRYFNIPIHGRHRGVSHFYLENYNTEDKNADLNMAKEFGEVVIDTYIDILTCAIENRELVTESDYQIQLDYHTLYFFQVLTMDRGTTSGLLVHDQNDIGILASLPSHINRALLVSWKQKMPKPQEQLLQSIIDCLGDKTVCLINDNTKSALANCLREHYQNHPEAIAMQASSYSETSTVGNHK
ncbi:MAG: coproporphyrinogen III oxidase [Psychromonas sp.]